MHRAREVSKKKLYDLNSSAHERQRAVSELGLRLPGYVERMGKIKNHKIFLKKSQTKTAPAKQTPGCNTTLKLIVRRNAE
jgi:hypothetical protein